MIIKFSKNNKNATAKQNAATKQNKTKAKQTETNRKNVIVSIGTSYYCHS